MIVQPAFPLLVRDESILRDDYLPGKRFVSLDARAERISNHQGTEPRVSAV